MPAPLRKTILGVVARHADAATWEQMHAAAQSEKTSMIKDVWSRVAVTPPGSEWLPGGPDRASNTASMWAASRSATVP